MRQGQQNRRGRGRSNNHQGRRGQNPLTRSFESTGPDVKIRGTPSHIAEKYLALARDAQASGDPVLAENYLQHAEHYNRIIMAFREQQIAQGGGEFQNGAGHRNRPFGEPVSLGEDYGDEEVDDLGGDVGAMPQPQPMRSHEGQPRHSEGQRQEDRGPRQDDRGPRMAEGQRHSGRERHSGFDRGERQDRDRERRHDRGDRGERGERFARPDRTERSEAYDRPLPPQAQSADQNGEAHQPPPRRAERALAHHEQPEFLRRPVRRPRRESSVPAEESAAPASSPAVEDSGRD